MEYNEREGGKEPLSKAKEVCGHMDFALRIARIVLEQSERSTIEKCLGTIGTYMYYSISKKKKEMRKVNCV